MIKSRCLMALLGGFMLAGVLTVGGCNTTPELKTTAMTAPQHSSRIERAVDHNMRQIWDDLDYMLLLDRPSHLTAYPIP